MFDRGLHYGDGLFETIAIRPFDSFRAHPFLSYHIARLSLGLERLSFPKINIDQLLQDLAQFIECVNQVQASSESWILKLIITRGQSKRGYIPETDSVPNIFMTQNPYPTYPDALYSEGIAVEWSDVILPIDPQLAGIKHLNRLPQVLAATRAFGTPTLNACQEVLLCNVNGYVIEGTKSNLFIVDANNEIKTPRLTESGVSGVMRAWIIAQLKAAGLGAVEVDVTPIDLQEAKEIFLCNSIIGIWPVRRLAEQTFTVGKISKKMQLMLKNLS